MTSTSRNRSSSSATSAVMPARLPTTRHQSRPEPWRSETARPSVSIGVKSANSWLIWKVRAMPSRTRRCGSRFVIDAPSSRISPPDGRSMPVSRLTNVVLPAPFGPIRAWRAPRRCRRTACRGSWSRARALPMRPPWSYALVRRGGPFGSTEHPGNLLLNRIDPPADTLPPDDHDGDKQQADPKLPVARREIGEVVLHQPGDQHADEAAIEIAGAADDEDQQGVGRAVDRKHGEGSES